MTVTSLEPSLIVRPLGGCGEIGLNATMLQVGDDVILVDCGMMLGLADAPGVDIAVPDYEALRRDGRLKSALRQVGARWTRRS